MKKLMKLLLVTCLALVVSGCGSSSDSDSGVKKLKVGTGANVNRIIYQENDEFKGFEVEFFETFAEKYEYELEFVVADFSALFGMLDTGKIDTIANQITENPQRLEKYDFTDPYCFIDYQFVVAKDADVTSIEWFKGKKVVVSDTANNRFVMEDFNETYNLGMAFTYLSDTTAVNQEIANGTYDCTFSAAITAQLSIDEQGLACKVVDPRDLAAPSGAESFGFYEINRFPVAKGQSKELVADLNEFIADLRASGDLSKMAGKYIDGLDFTNEPVVE